MKFQQGSIKKQNCKIKKYIHFVHAAQSYYSFEKFNQKNSCFWIDAWASWHFKTRMHSLEIHSTETTFASKNFENW